MKTTDKTTKQTPTTRDIVPRSLTFRVFFSLIFAVEYSSSVYCFNLLLDASHVLRPTMFANVLQWFSALLLETIHKKHKEAAKSF